MNKIKYWMIFVSIMFFAFFITPVTMAEQGVAVMIDRQVINFTDQQALIDSENNRVYIPIRVVEEIGAEVSWEENKAVIKKGETVIIMENMSKDPVVNGVIKSLDAPAKLVNGRLMVPIRFICETFGVSVDWDSTNKIVRISTKDNAIKYKYSGRIKLSEAPPKFVEIYNQIPGIVTVDEQFIVYNPDDYYKARIVIIASKYTPNSYVVNVKDTDWITDGNCEVAKQMLAIILSSEEQAAYFINELSIAAPGEKEFNAYGKTCTIRVIDSIERDIALCW